MDKIFFLYKGLYYTETQWKEYLKNKENQDN